MEIAPANGKVHGRGGGGGGKSDLVCVGVSQSSSSFDSFPFRFLSWTGYLP